jgi:twitching motility protein PilI
VVDLARFFGAQEAAAIGAATRLVTFAPSLGMPCGFLATRVHGLRQAADMTPQDGRLVDADGTAWTPLALAALAQDERFLQVGL